MTRRHVFGRTGWVDAGISLGTFADTNRVKVLEAKGPPWRRHTSGCRRTFVPQRDGRRSGIACVHDVRPRGIPGDGDGWTREGSGNAASRRPARQVEAERDCVGPNGRDQGGFGPRRPIVALQRTRRRHARQVADLRAHRRRALRLSANATRRLRHRLVAAESRGTPKSPAWSRRKNAISWKAAMARGGSTALRATGVAMQAGAVSLPGEFRDGMTVGTLHPETDAEALQAVIETAAEDEFLRASGGRS